MKTLQLNQVQLLNESEKSLFKVFSSNKVKGNLRLKERLKSSGINKLSKNLQIRVEKIEKYVSKEHAIKYLIGYLEYSNNKFQ